MTTRSTNGGHGSDADAADVFPRISTGSLQADAVLAGGFPARSINIVMGQPGTGKTIFAEQLLYHNVNGASDGRPVLYVTTLSEPMAKVVSYVQRFSFFVEEKLGTSILYEDLGPLLSEQGPAALVTWLRNAIRTMSPRIIVIDSFRALHDLSESVPDMRRLVSDFAGLASAYDTTVFLLGEYTTPDIDRYPEFAVADAIVELARHPRNSRDERFFRVLKLRGSAYREGQHAFRIGKEGLQFYPRLVSPAVPTDYDPRTERVPTGISGLDEMVGGGLWAGSTTLLAGSTGSGKTTLALQFALEGIRRDEGVLFVNFQENPSQLRRCVANLGMDPALAAERGLHLAYSSPVELQIDSILIDIFERISAGDVRRVVVDAIGELSAAASDAQRVYDYLYSLAQHFVVSGVTSVFTYESNEASTGAVLAQSRVGYISDNLLQIDVTDEHESTRTLRVVKSRNSSHDRRARTLEIDAHGGRIL